MSQIGDIERPENECGDETSPGEHLGDGEAPEEHARADDLGFLFCGHDR
jgi:hypothetical protein